MTDDLSGSARAPGGHPLMSKLVGGHRGIEECCTACYPDLAVSTYPRTDHAGNPA